MTYTVHLPVALTPPSILGIEAISPAAQVERIRDCNPGWVRWNGVRWPDDIGHDNLAALDRLPYKTIAVIHANGFVPDVGQQAMIADYLSCLAAQYPHIDYWELGNECDVPRFQSSVYLGGGWEDKAAEYAAFYAMVKRHNPGLRILSAGLCEIGVWIQTVLCLAKLDGISFHAYSAMPWVNDYNLRQRIAKLRLYTDIDLYLTETSLLSTYDDNDAAKAEYLSIVHDTARAEDLRCAIWYTVGGNGWQHSDLAGASLDLFKALT